MTASDPQDISVEKEILDKSVEFPVGLPGFPLVRQFVFTQDATTHPFAWMRSLDEKGLSFVVIEAYHLLPDYSADISDVDLETIGSPSPAQTALFFIVKIEKTDRVRLHVNTNAPIIVNVVAHRGRQVLVPADSAEQPRVFEL